MSGKRVLVTGGSRGIGRAIALRLAQDGWSVALHYTEHFGDAEKVQSELGKAFSGLYQLDLTDYEKAPELLKQVMADGALDAVVNNAGVYLPLDFLGSSDAIFRANWHKTFAINLSAPILMMREAGRIFANQGGGKILNVASRVGFKGEGGAALYAASKAALINMTRSLAVELAPKNVRLFGIAPGWVDTAMARDGMQERLENILATIPLDRMASPEDCAGAAAFLLSSDAEYLSGVVIDINGASYFH